MRTKLMARCEGVMDEYACLKCNRPECLFEHQDDMAQECMTYHQRYYEAHREEILRKQREYDKTHPRSRRRKKK